MSPGQAEPRYDGIAQSRPEQTEEERARAEALRRWKEGDSPKEEKKGIFGTSDLPYRAQSLGSSTLLEHWKLKAGISLGTTVMLLIPYFSYWIWFVLLPPLRVIVPSSPSLQLDVFTGNFHEPSIWGQWIVEGGSYFPSILGFLLFFTYFYFWSNMFIPEYKMKQHVFITILWFWFFISWAIGMPPSPFEWFFTDI
ncbi:uncharacterized protein METZ01_LOCUS229563 [marine metagenome]|uniref:Uncharacterized protein n=1 Tax=marine metagenome TaxID=408172 RepID=A0A382GNZ5_9ZZZZ